MKDYQVPEWAKPRIVERDEITDAAYRAIGVDPDVIGSPYGQVKYGFNYGRSQAALAGRATAHKCAKSASDTTYNDRQSPAESETLQGKSL